MLNRKVMMTHLIARLMKQILSYKMNDFPDSYARSKSKIKLN